MKVTIWSNGSSTFGIRVNGPENVQRFFDKSWKGKKEEGKGIQLQLDDEFYPYPLYETFWTTCPEFRGGQLNIWIRKKDLDKGDTLELLPLGENRFTLVYNCNG
jgi:hypothetical protein